VRTRAGLFAAAAGVGGALVAVAGLQARLRRYAVAQQSMAPTLNDGDWVLAHRTSAPPRRGEVIVFEHPVRPGFALIKRVVGLPLEIVTISNGDVHIDGRVLVEPWAGGATRPDSEWQLNRDEIFVLSDARVATIADSRAFGPVPCPNPRWSVRFRYWPVGAIGSLARSIRPDV